MPKKLVKEIGKLSLHDHLCVIYGNADEQLSAAIPFITFGLDRGEKCLCITDKKSAHEIKKALGAGSAVVRSSMLPRIGQKGGDYFLKCATRNADIVLWLTVVN